MKIVIFICLLSISFCLTKPADEQVTAKPQQKNDVTMDLKAPAPTETSVPIVITTESKATNQMSNNSTPTQTTTNPADAKPKETKPADENKTKKTEEPPKEESKKVEPPKEAPAEVKPSTETKDKITTTSKPAETKTEKPEEKVTVVTTQKSDATVKPTEAPKKEDDKPVLQARGFDGPSFIGGIILTLGLLAISFMGFKYYKNQTERNYHTL